ncbi:uncharacterized protein [Notothenia coriiceps]|uniref:Uncharacterized protein n=1 Tax=Notothenia coriiceps TaxID=8208 RepID=A0A6I9NQE3_9TELE|nr:PREDICTED: uncharacterized protein LOC104954551 [Notothenia coriiceps]
MGTGAGTEARTMAVRSGSGAGNMAVRSGSGAGNMTAGAGTGAGNMAVWSGSGAGNMAVRSGAKQGPWLLGRHWSRNHGLLGAERKPGPWLCKPGNGVWKHGCVGRHWSMEAWTRGPVLEQGPWRHWSRNHDCWARNRNTGPWLCGMVLEHGTMAAGSGAGAGTMAVGRGTLALRLLGVFWRLRGPPNARPDPKKGSENEDWLSGLREKILSHSGNKLQSQGLRATS